jgi:hypothetical protein
VIVSISDGKPQAAGIDDACCAVSGNAASTIGYCAMRAEPLKLPAMNAMRQVKRQVIEKSAVALEACLNVVQVAPPATLLILAHMRSGSTLLLHLLLMSDEISGMGERNTAYLSSGDLSRLAIATRVASRAPFRRLRYVVDQVNHNPLTPNSRVLNDPRVRLLFLIRQPQPAIGSLMELSRNYFPHSWTVTRAVDYYIERLRALSLIAEHLTNPKGAAFVAYEALTDSPQETLESLRSFLGLRLALSQTYRTHSFTRRRGDPMPTIATGQIRRRESPANLELSASDLERVTTAHLQCTRALTRFALRGPP